MKNESHSKYPPLIKRWIKVGNSPNLIYTLKLQLHRLDDNTEINPNWIKFWYRFWMQLYIYSAVEKLLEY